MLRTDARSLLVDLLAPPQPDDRLVRAVGTTFTLHLDALLRVPLAVVGTEWEERMDPLGVMECVRSSVDRIDIFCQTGMVAVPDQPSALLAFLEPLIHPVRRPRRDRLFHPKVWVAQFAGADGRQRFRMLCGSRNLTNDRAWDTVVGLDGEATSRPQSLNTPLVKFLESLPARVAGRMSRERRGGVQALAASIANVVWEPIPETGAREDWLHFHWLDRNRPFEGKLDGASRRIVISPFLNTEGLRRVAPDAATTLITRREALADLDDAGRDWLSEHTEAVLEMDDSAALPDEDAEDLSTRWSLRGLHAKVVLFDRGQDAHAFIGSANATDAAWNGNTEFMVELVGSRRLMGTRALLSEADGSLSDILRPCRLSEVPERPEPTYEERLQRALVDLATTEFTATATVDASDRWQLRIKADPIAGSALPNGARLSLRPLTVEGARRADAGVAIDECWSDLEGDHITPFLALELAGTDGRREVRVGSVVLARLIGGPEDRLDRVIARHVGSPEAFLRFLMVLLQAGRTDAPALPLLDGTGGCALRGLFGAGGEGVLEAMASALADHPQTIDEIDRLVARLKATDEGLAVLPEGWDALWPSILNVRRELDADGKRDA